MYIEYIPGNNDERTMTLITMIRRLSFVQNCIQLAEDDSS